VFSSLGSTEVGGTAETLEGLGEVDGVLYGAGGADVDTLYSINTTDGALSSIGAATSIEYADFGSTLTGLYAISTTDHLYSINPTNGIETQIGTGLLPGGGTSSLSTGSNTLYLTAYSGTAYTLYTINTSTGAATPVGPTGPSTGVPIGALMWDGISTLYGGQDTPDPLYVDTLSTTAGTATESQPLTGTSSNIYGFAPIPTTSTPEPDTWSLMVAAMGILAFIKRR